MVRWRDRRGTGRKCCCGAMDKAMWRNRNGPQSSPLRVQERASLGHSWSLPKQVGILCLENKRLRAFLTKNEGGSKAWGLRQGLPYVGEHPWNGPMTGTPSGELGHYLQENREVGERQDQLGKSGRKGRNVKKVCLIPGNQENAMLFLSTSEKGTAFILLFNREMEPSRMPPIHSLPAPHQSSCPSILPPTPLSFSLTSPQAWCYKTRKNLCIFLN